jgi:hypothetical protein
MQATRRKPETKKPQKKRAKRNPLLLNVYINEPEYTSAFELFVYDTLKDLEQGINDWHLREGVYDHAKVDNYLGLFVERTPLEEKVVDGVNFLLFGTMFLCKEALSIGTIVHECLHATISNERRCVRYEGLYGEHPDNGADDEERVAYKIESYVESIILKCREKKIDILLELDE